MPRLLALLLVFIAPSAAAQEITFERLDGPRGGDAEVVVASDGTLFVRTAGWARSDDGGDTWTALEEPLNHLTPLTGDTLLAGTPDGVQFSTDDGRSWTRLGLAGRSVRQVARQPDGTVWAWADSLLYSPDNGATWLGGMRGLDELGYGCPLTLLKPLGDDLYGGTAGCGPLGYGSGLGRWNPDSLAWEELPVATGTFLGGVFQDVLITHDETLWASSTSGWMYSDGGLFRTERDSLVRMQDGDFRSLFEPTKGRLLVGTPNGLYMVGAGGTLGRIGLAHLSVASLGKDAEGTLYAGTSAHCNPFIDPPIVCIEGFGAYRKKPDADVWEALDPGRSRTTVKALTQGKDRLWTGTLNGLWFTDDHGATWTFTAGVTPEDCQQDWCSPFDDGFGGSVSLHESRSGEVRVVNPGARALYRLSQDDTWDRIDVYPLHGFIDAGADTLLIGSHSGISRSEDDGATWSAVHDAEVYVFSRTPSGALLAGGNGLWRSTNTGLTWAAVDLDVQGHEVRTLTLAPSGAIYAATDRLYRSDDDGLTWTEVASELPYLVQLLADADGALFGRNEYGPVLASFDEGATWEPLTSAISITSLALDAEGYLYAGTEGDGLWRTTRPTAVTIADGVVPEAIDLIAYPNPFAAHATVRFALPQAGPVTLTVYDLLGRRVAVLAEGTLAAGIHRASLDGTALPSGVYVLQLTSEGRSTTRLLTHLR